MNLVDILKIPFDFMKAVEFDFSSVGIPISVNLYEIFWGFVIIGIFFEIINHCFFS